MAFNTNIFIFIFLPFTIIFYQLFDKKYKKYLLFMASMFFYLWSGLYNIKFVFVLLLINYLGSIILHRYNKKNILTGIIFLNVLLLFYFKYTDYVIANLNSYFSLEINLIEVLIPLGISFIIFHAISLQVDTYRNKELFSYNFIDFGLYLIFFPKLLQGPIVQYRYFKAQLESLDYNYEFFITGVERFIIGLAKKVIIADTLNTTVIKALGYWKSYGIDQPTYWIILLLYVFVIYFDFSGYSDMAIGLSRMFGFNIKENFNFPYVSKSITEFWRRWHISLGDWFKEYVYIPLGGNRNGNVYINLLIVFCLTGLWHGAGFLYLFWGLLHGGFILVERVLLKKNLLHRIPSAIGWTYTTIIVSFGWLIFLLPSSDVLLPYLQGLFGNVTNDYIPFTYQYILSSKIIITLIIAAFGSYALALPKIQLPHVQLSNNSLWYVSIKYIFLILLLLYSILAIISGTYSPFIYFQF